MGSKNFTIFLNVIGSGYKLGRCTPHPSIQNFRKLKRCANSNNYHISAQKLKEIQKQINEGKKETQKELLSGSLKDKSLEDKKEVSNDDNGKIESLKIKGASALVADSSKQSNTDGEIVLPSKPEKESESSVQEDVSKTIGKLQGEKIFEENKTKRNEKGKGIRLNMIDTFRREMKGSYSSLRQKLQDNRSNSKLFGPRTIPEDKEKTDIMNDINARAFNTFDSIVSNQVESKQTEKNDELFKENSPQKMQIVENGLIDKENVNVSGKEIKENMSQKNQVMSVGKKQIDKAEENILEEKSNIIKGTVMLNRSESMSKTNLNISENDLKSSQSIQGGQENSNIMEVKSEKSGNKASNLIDNSNKNSSFNMIKTSKYTGNESSVKHEYSNILEVDGQSTKKYMLNTLLDPIAKSSKKMAENRGLSSQSEEDLNGTEAGRKAQQIDEKGLEQKQKIDESVIPGMGNTKMEALNSTKPLLRENTENISKENTVHGLHIKSNEQGEQKNQVMPKMIDNQSSISGGEKNKYASTDVLKENIIKLSNKNKVQGSESILNQQVDKKNEEKPEIDNKLNVSRKEDNKIEASTNSLKGAVESGSNEIKIQTSNDKEKISGHMGSVYKLNSLKTGEFKTQSSKISPGKGRAKPKYKSTLKLKYRLKDTLKDQLQENEKLENLKKLVTDEYSAEAHKIFDQQIPLREEINLHKENAVANEKVDLQQNPMRKEINLYKEGAAAQEKVDQQKPVRKEINLHKESVAAQETVDQQKPVRKEINLHKESVAAQEKVDQQKPVRKEMNLHKESAAAQEKVDQQKPVRKEINLQKESAAAHEKVDLEQKPMRKGFLFDKESAVSHEKVDLEQKPMRKGFLLDKESAVSQEKVDLEQKPMRKGFLFDKESGVSHEKVDLEQKPMRKGFLFDKESAVSHENVDLHQKPVRKEIQLHKEPHSALTKQEEFSKISSQVAAVENPQNIERSLDKIGIKQDFNERGILAFDSSYIMKQLAKSRRSESIEEIPGPKLMRVCSNIVNALPVIGTLTISSLMRSYNRLCLSYGDKKFVSNRMSKPLESLFNTHGDIVCLNIPLCGNVIIVDKPELIHEVYRQRDMSQMMNSTFDSLNEVYNVLGKKNMRLDAINTVDEQMTCVIEHFDLKNLFWSANRYHDSLEKISDQLVQRITFTRDMHNEVPRDFIKELNKWSLECMMQVLFATEIGSLRSASYLGHQETDRVLRSLTDATDALRDCESGIQLWRVYQTASFTKLTESIKHLERFLCKHIPLLKHDTKLEQRLEMLQSNLESKQNASSLISGLILSGYVDVDKLLKICMETMLIAVNTTSTSLGFVLYHLARNQEKQKVLHKELMSVLPDKVSKLNPEVLQELPYLNACVQETLRLKHPIPYSVMRLQRSIVLHKYYIPAGTWVMTANEVACMREENFEDAQLFKPERWLECSPELYQDTISPLLEAQFEPFLGRDWLQKQLLVGTAKIIRNFNVRYRYGEIGTEGEFLSKPTKPFQFEFLEQHV